MFGRIRQAIEDGVNEGIDEGLAKSLPPLFKQISDATCIGLLEAIAMKFEATPNLQFTGANLAKFFRGLKQNFEKPK